MIAFVRTLFFSVILLATSLYAQDDVKRQIADVGTPLSMAWSKGGVVSNDLRNIAESAKKLAKVKVDQADLQSARLNFFAVATLYDQGFQQQRGHKVTPQDIEDGFNGIKAGLSEDPGQIAGVVLTSLFRAAEMAKNEGKADALIGVAVKQHGKLWTDSMLPIVKKTAGPAADFQPFRVLVEKSKGKGKTGLKLSNVTGDKLTNVTVAIDSTIGSAQEGGTTHYIFIPVWTPGLEIGLPWRLTAAVTDAQKLQGKTVTYSMWSNEYSLEKQTYELPANLAVTAKPEFRLALKQVDGPTGKPPAK